MPSNDERRQVAARLRELIKQYGIPSAERFYELLDKTLEDPSGYHSYVSVILYLADLIEPAERTCEMVDIPDGWEDADGTTWPDCWVCDDCGVYTFGVMVNPDTMFRPNFCPNCGARVTE